MYCNPEAQRKQIEFILQEDSLNVAKEGAKYYVLNVKWWNIWKSYVNWSENDTSETTPTIAESSRPTSIDNSDMVDTSGQLKPSLLENLDCIRSTQSCLHIETFFYLRGLGNCLYLGMVQMGHR